MEPNEIMTVQEVAEYLRVSERTVYDWAQKGEIPAGKLGNVWRFSRPEVQAWVARRLGSESRPEEGGHSGFRALLPESRICFFEGGRKSEILGALIDRLAHAEGAPDRETLASAIFEREDLMSTGIGLGVGIPHVRLPGMDHIVMAAGASRTGIEDYESLDGQPVRLVFVIAAGSKQHSEYLRLLSRLTRMIRDEQLRTALMDADTPAAFRDILAQGV